MPSDVPGGRRRQPPGTLGTRLLRRMPPPWLVCAGLILMVTLIYGQCAQAGFIAFDDDTYLSANPVVRAGLTWAGLRWAFTTFWAFRPRVSSTTSN